MKGQIWIFFDAVKDQQSKSMSLAEAQSYLNNLTEVEKEHLYLWTPGWETWIKVNDYTRDQKQSHFTEQKLQPPKTSAILNQVISQIQKKKLAQTTTPEKAQEKTQEKTQEQAPENSEVFTKVTTQPSVTAPLSSSSASFQADFNGDELNWDPQVSAQLVLKNKKDQERRKTRRQDFKIRVMIVAPQKNWQTFSEDISMGGTLLEDEIPKEFLNQPFDLILINPLEKDPIKSKVYFKTKIVGDIMNPRRLMFLNPSLEMSRRLHALLEAYATYMHELKSSA